MAESGEFRRLYPEHVTPTEHSMRAPRPENGPVLEAVLRAITFRAGRRSVPIRGWIDEIGTWVEGWAQDVTSPELPVLLEVLVQGSVVGTALACFYRDDLAKAGIGQGWCRFMFRLPANLSGAARRGVRYKCAGRWIKSACR